MIKSKRMRWAGHVARHKGGEAYMFLVVNPEGNRPLGKTRCRWENNIEMDLGEAVA
jgi:hypothetical protein